MLKRYDDFHTHPEYIQREVEESSARIARQRANLLCMSLTVALLIGAGIAIMVLR